MGERKRVGKGRRGGKEEEGERKKRGEGRRGGKEEEGERNGKHDLEIAKIYTVALRSPTVRVPQGMPLREKCDSRSTGLSQQPNDISEHRLYPTTR